ncbi:hypothetical protein DPEC_G00370290 [Dallia pectoralis]|nr:hypothetical protein DPEC_G00370290 [Dallia pectoralis]
MAKNPDRRRWCGCTEEEGTRESYRCGTEEGFSNLHISTSSRPGLFCLSILRPAIIPFWLQRCGGVRVEGALLQRRALPLICDYLEGQLRLEPTIVRSLLPTPRASALAEACRLASLICRAGRVTAWRSVTRGTVSRSVAEERLIVRHEQRDQPPPDHWPPLPTRQKITPATGREKAWTCHWPECRGGSGRAWLIACELTGHHH